jgi:DNA-binding MarR family transcriptional regulator
MSRVESSSSFIKSAKRGEHPLGPPMIGALLRVPLEAVHRHMLERLHENGFEDFDQAYVPVFHYPGPQGLRPTDIAAQLGISKQALNYLLRELERLHYLEREPHPDDLRAKRIVLTNRGAAAALVIRDAVREMEARWTKQLGAKRFAELRALLVELNQLD